MSLTFKTLLEWNSLSLLSRKWALLMTRRAFFWSSSILSSMHNFHILNDQRRNHDPCRRWGCVRPAMFMESVTSCQKTRHSVYEISHFLFFFRKVNKMLIFLLHVLLKEPLWSVTLNVTLNHFQHLLYIKDDTASPELPTAPPNNS